MPTCASVFVTKCVEPIQCFNVPNTSLDGATSQGHGRGLLVPTLLHTLEHFFMLRTSAFG